MSVKNISSPMPDAPPAPPIDRKDWPSNRSAGGLLTLRRVADQIDTHLHDHTFDELAYVRAGRATHLTAHGERPLTVGDLVILRPLVWHAYRKCQGFAVDNLIFDAEFLTHFFPLLDRQSSWFELFHSRAALNQAGPLVIRLGEEEQRIIFWALDHMAEEQAAAPLAWESATAATALLAISHTARAMSRTMALPRPALSPRAEEAVRTVARTLQAHPARPISVPELARSVSLSPHYLSRAFARHMGTGIVNYVHRLRVEQACRLLRSTGLPIAQIATQMGYDEIAYFSRRFRQQIGCSPSTYRRRVVGL